MDGSFEAEGSRQGHSRQARETEIEYSVGILSFFKLLKVGDCLFGKLKNGVVAIHCSLSLLAKICRRRFVGVPKAK